MIPIFLHKHINNRNHIWKIKNINGTKEDCKIVYFPILSNYDETKSYNPPRVLIEVGKSDFREVPYVYLEY